MSQALLKAKTTPPEQSLFSQAMPEGPATT
jgi:hypothetical protein